MPTRNRLVLLDADDVITAVATFHGADPDQLIAWVYEDTSATCDHGWLIWNGCAASTDNCGIDPLDDDAIAATRPIKDLIMSAQAIRHLTREDITASDKATRP